MKEQDLFDTTPYIRPEKYFLIGKYAILDNGHSPSAVLHVLYELGKNPLDQHLYHSERNTKESLLALNYTVIEPQNDELVSPKHNDSTACKKPTKVIEILR